MQKRDYQQVLDNIDRRKIEKLKEFFKQIPLLKLLPRNVINTLHLSVTKVTCLRGQRMCREGDDSLNLFIVTKGEFEVSKLVDVNP